MVSILLPISNTEDPKLIDRCLFSLKRQTYKDFEVLIVTSKQPAQKIKKITHKYPFVKILEKNLGKGAARNFAAKKAKGEYLYHLDADMTPSPKVLSECLKKAKSGTQAIIIPDQEAPSPHFISRCRALERRLLHHSHAVIAPLFLTKSLFEKAGGYDESLDPMDDWSLHLNLKKLGVKPKSIKPPVLVKETTSFIRALERKYKMGQIYPAFKTKYSFPPHLNPKLRFADYFRNRRELLKSPLVSIGLFFLKIGDILFFFWGTLHPIRPKNRYQFPKIAQEYEKKRLGTNYGHYKHFSELKALFTLLPKKPTQILEVGCGTGRVTQELIKKGYQVTPIDSSQAMLSQYQQKKDLPKPKLLSATSLPLKDNSYPTVVALRVIWHLPKKDITKMLSEVTRVSSNIIILDITNKNRWPKIYRSRYPNEYFFEWEEFSALCKKFNLKIEKRLPLDTLFPFWLNLLPARLAVPLFPKIYRTELWLSKIIPPGRFLIKLKKL
jgi:glycosyltransferase involved in cell wall biosynthesis